MKSDLGIYIHIPFCRKRCDYCDFVSFCADESAQRLYIEDLLKEVEFYRGLIEGSRLTTVYFGGGTPSALPLSLLERLFEGLPASFFEVKEVSFEMNPESVTREKLALLKRVGVNRISLGVQSFDEKTLQVLGRIHSADDVRLAVQLIREAGFTNLNLDLMYAIGEAFPIQESLKELLHFSPEHISTYPLEIYDYRPIANKLSPADEEISFDEFAFIQAELSAYGYVRYEVSNFAKDGFASLHNTAYWQRKDYLGLGVGAHSLLGSHRHSNVSELATYHMLLGRGESPVKERTQLSLKEEAFETWMLGFRLREGVLLSDYRTRYGDLSAHQKKSMERFKAQGLLEEREGRLALTERGMDLMNVVLLGFMDEESFASTDPIGIQY